jgi:succinyl-diaminopimelate desuccinylase
MNYKKNILLNEDKCKNILSKLIKVNSTHPEGNEMDVIREILLILKSYDIDYDIFENGKNRGSLAIKIKGKKNTKPIAFIGHIDTVPVDDYDEWEHPPFDAYFDGEYLHGRGSADMKGGVTSMIITLLYLLDNRITPNNDVYFCFTSDEELNGKGILSLKESGLLDHVKEIFICEPSNEKIGLSEKGALWLEIQVEGLSSHGSRPDLGVNAVEYLIKFVQEFKRNIDRETEDSLLGKTTISINKFHGGLKTNVVPTNAKASLDIRTIPTHNHEDIIKAGKDIRDKLIREKSNLKININIENNRSSVETKKEEKFIKKIEKLSREVLNKEVDFKGLYFYTDASQIIPDLKVPFVILGPGDDAMAHQRNEKIKLKSVIRIAEIYIRYLIKN